jgi:septal ring factor EnvC (AmiA/AmiB activator)
MRVLAGALACGLALEVDPLHARDQATGAGEREVKESELETLRRQIESTRARVEESRLARDELQDELQRLERRGAELAADLRRAEEALRAARGRLESLGADRSARERELALERDALARQVRAEFRLGQRDYLAILLNQQDPSTISRALAYHRYYTRARADRVRAVREQIDALAEVESSIRAQEGTLKELQAEKATAQAALGAERAARGELLARLHQTVRAGGDELRRLGENARELERVIEALRGVIPDVPETLGGGPGFAERKGSLPWPTAGRIRHAFGSPRQAAGLLWQGVLLEARRGGVVTAVHLGRVAFADWLRGFGLLVVLDHGEGYMTLYGHNETLLKQVGEWVDTGEALATVGDSGGQATTGLYFEVRRQGSPLNPAEWCRGTPPRDQDQAGAGAPR